MFCSQCGVENQLEALFCQKCGNALSGEISHSKVAAQPQVIDSAIWNPNAAANWSLIFTPAFGAYLQMLNWRTLGEAEKSASSQNWFYVSLGMLVIYILLALFIKDANAAEGASRGLGFLFLLIWYFSVGRAQGKYVKAKFGASYIRKPWGKVLLIGVAASIGFFLAAVIVGFAKILIAS